MSIRTRDLLRQIAFENELEIITGKVAKDHVYITSTYSKYQQDNAMIKGHQLQSFIIRVCSPPEKVLGSPSLARGYLAVSSRNITDEMIQQYIEEQDGETVVDDSRFQIAPIKTLA